RLALFRLLMYSSALCPFVFLFFFFSHSSSTEIYPLSLHDALPICPVTVRICRRKVLAREVFAEFDAANEVIKSGVAVIDSGIDKDRKSTRLNSSHGSISYAVFCLKKKMRQIIITIHSAVYIDMTPE